MKTINEVLHFLNKLDFVGYLRSAKYEKFNCIKKVLLDEFQDVNAEKLINMLGVVDELYILFITQVFHDVQILTYKLRCDIFLPVKKKLKMNKLFCVICLQAINTSKWL